MQNTNALSQQLNNMAATNAQCCCENRNLITSSFADLNYNLASQACQNRQAVNEGVRDIIDNTNASMRYHTSIVSLETFLSLNQEVSDEICNL